MFIDEARLARYLKHPNIAQVYEFGRLEGTYFIAFELVKGPTVQQLARHCAEHVGYIPVPIVLEIGMQLCEALYHAHNMVDEENLPLGIVHRDVSPQNLIVSTVGFVKLIDFGLAKAKQSSAESHSGILKGKPSYIAPEYLDGQLDVRCDIWAAGVVLHELLTGKRMFEAADPVQMVAAVRSKEIRPPSRHRPEVNDALDDVIMTALERDPTKRWQNAASLRAALATQAKEFPVVTKSQLVAWVEWAFKQKKLTREDSGVAAFADIQSDPVELVEATDDEASVMEKLPATVAAVEERRRESVASMTLEQREFARPTAPASRGPLIVLIAGLLILVGVVVIVLVR
jgi:serine/threonine protein kinase